MFHFIGVSLRTATPCAFGLILQVAVSLMVKPIIYRAQVKHSDRKHKQTDHASLLKSIENSICIQLDFLL